MNNKDLETIQNILSKNSEKKGSCIEWTGKTSLGYGYFYTNKTLWRCHRASFLIANGKIPNGLHILHKCNNKKCINPEHLYAGTDKDNARDFKNSLYYNECIKKSIEVRKINKKKRIEEFRKCLPMFYSVQEFSDIVNMHKNTILYYINHGIIRAIRLRNTNRSPFRIPVSEIERIATFNLEEIIEKLAKQPRRLRRIIKN